MKYIILSTFLLFVSVYAKADDCSPIDGGKYVYTVRDFTNYSPRYGGINGRCGRSASGLDACKYFLEDHLSGKTYSVMGAVLQRGGTSGLFGGMYRAPSLERSIGTNKCIKVIAADRYATKSNGLSKMDIVTKNKKSNLTARVNAASGSLVLLGRAPGVGSSRKLQRKLASVAPTKPTKRQKQRKQAKKPSKKKVENINILSNENYNPGK